MPSIATPRVNKICSTSTIATSHNSDPVSAPIYLLHGRDDNVIPAVESRRLADRLRGQVSVRLLETNLISHAEADQPAHVTDVLKLARFWEDLLER